MSGFTRTVNQSRRKVKAGTAEHRPALQRRRNKHDEPRAVDLFSGFGGLTEAVKRAGFAAITAANHNRYKVQIHERNHPEVEHWIADLVDPTSSDYHSAADLPPADLLAAGISCTSHSQANTQRAYAQGLTLFDIKDEEYEERVTRSEKDRATALCVLQYAGQHRPRLILVECTTEFQSWGPALPGKPKIGDGTTYQWWLRELEKLDYQYKILYLNSQFFNTPQSRDRWFGVFWHKSLPAPDLEHRPMSWCHRCNEVLPAAWTWKTGVPPSGSVRYGKQYMYTCPRCRREVIPPMTPSVNALDLTNLGTRIGDRAKPLAPATMARGEWCRQRFADFPAIIMPAKATYGAVRHLGQPMATQTSQQEAALLSTGSLITGNVIAAHRHNGDGQHISRPMDTVTTTHEKALLLAAITNYQGAPRGLNEALPTQGASETLGLVSAPKLAVMSSGVVPFRQNTVPTVTAAQIPGLVTAAGIIKNNGSIGEASYRAHPVSDPLGSLVASASNQALMTSGWWTPQNDAEWRQRLAELSLEDCYFRMLSANEVGVGCGFDVDRPGHKGTFIVWGSARDQVDGYGNAVSPAVGEWISGRMRVVLDSRDTIPASGWL